MNGNPDEIYEDCIEEALTAINENDYIRAYGYLNRAKEINPYGEEVVELLEYIRPHIDNDNINHKQNDSDSQTRWRNNNKDSSDMNHEENHGKPETEYTTEQIEIVQKIKKCKDYYEVLGIKRTATDTEIKKAYKKLALQLHPDKNHAPGAAEAFKAVSNAVAILTDAQKRKEYDLFGSQNDRNNGQNHYHHFHYNTNNRFHMRRSNNYESAYEHGFESNISAEELFNMFFGNEFPLNNDPTRFAHYHYNRETINEHANLAFGVILILVILSILTSLFSPDPFYDSFIYFS